MDKTRQVWLKPGVESGGVVATSQRIRLAKNSRLL